MRRVVSRAGHGACWSVFAMLLVCLFTAIVPHPLGSIPARAETVEGTLRNSTDSFNNGIVLGKNIAGEDIDRS